MKKLFLASFALIGASVVSSQVLAADNRQNYNGSYCSSYYGSQATSVGHYYNGAYNGSGAGMYISCPVIVDEASVTTGTNNVWIYTSAAGTSCTLFSMNGNGTSLQSQWGAGGPGWFAVPNLTADDYWGSYSMYCYLPAGATLNTISISEKP